MCSLPQATAGFSLFAIRALGLPVFFFNHDQIPVLFSLFFIIDIGDFVVYLVVYFF